MAERIEDGGPAFPIPATAEHPGNGGVSVRDYLAAHALAGICANQQFGFPKDGERGLGQFKPWICSLAYELADAMLAARREFHA